MGDPVPPCGHGQESRESCDVRSLPLALSESQMANRVRIHKHKHLNAHMWSNAADPPLLSVFNVKS